MSIDMTIGVPYRTKFVPQKQDRVFHIDLGQNVPPQGPYKPE